MDLNIAALATRLQDQKDQLDKEKNAVNATDNDLQRWQDKLRDEETLNRNVRREYLESRQRLIEIELEKYRSQDAAAERRKRKEKLFQEKEDIKRRHLEEKAAWEEHEDDLLRHKIKQTIFLRSIKASLNKREKAKTRRNLKLQFLSEKTDELRRKKEEVMKDSERLKRSGDTKKKDIEKMALDTQEAIAERVALRQSLKEVRKAYDDANNEVRKLEEEYESHQTRL